MTDSFGGFAETHTGVVLFLGDRAFKIKKPVNLGFLDHREVDARRASCEHEIELNSRLAADVYLGVGELTQPGVREAEPMVVMRRLPAERRLSSLISSGVDMTSAVRDVARVLATFHSKAERSAEIDAAATVSALARGWQTHLAEMREVTGSVVSLVELDRIEALALRYLEGREHMIDERIARGWICDGHGDLLADDIFCMEDGPRILDCLDFDDRLRHIDVLSDVAFLAMDFERLGRRDLAAQLLQDYDEFSGEVHPPSLSHHYVAYRASVRSKVAAIRFLQTGDPQDAAEARRLSQMALGHLEAGRVRLVLIGGLPGTGKSTLAEALGAQHSWTVISSDVVRKELAGLPGETDASSDYESGIYVPEMTSATYRRMLKMAMAGLRMGESVILDASWCRERAREAAAEVGYTTCADVTQLMCVADAPIVAERIATREGDPMASSDASMQIAIRMREECMAWPDACEIDTSHSVEEALSRADAAIYESERAGANA